MKHSLAKALPWLTAALACTSWLSCGSGVAGGTGTGNPPVIAAQVSLSVDTTQPEAGLARALLRSEGGQGGQFAPLELSVNSFTITDQEQLAFTIDSAFIYVQKIHLVAQQPDECRRQLRLIDSELLQDSIGIVLEGPFAFDIMRPSALTGLSGLTLPAITYAGVRLTFDTTQGRFKAGPDENDLSCGEAMTLRGTFEFNGARRPFVFALRAQPTMFLPLDSSAEVSANDANVHFAIRYRTEEWLDSISINGCLISGGAGFLGDSTFVLSGCTIGAGPCRGLEAQIGAGIVRSGYAQLLRF